MRGECELRDISLLVFGGKYTFFESKTPKKVQAIRGECELRNISSLVFGGKVVFFETKKTNLLSRRVEKFAIALNRLLLCCTAPTEDQCVHVGQFAFAPYTLHLFWSKTFTKSQEC